MNIKNLFSFNKKGSDPIDANLLKFGSRMSSAGVKVNANTALQHQAVYSCIRILAESVGQLPLKLYKNKSGRLIEVTSGRLHKIYTQKPNDYQTTQEFIETLVTSLMGSGGGNFYAETVRNNLGNIAKLVPFQSQLGVSVQMNSDGEVIYSYVTNDGKSKQCLGNSDIFHIKLNSNNGYKGLSPIAQNAQSIGLGMACEEHAASTFENGAFPKTALKMDGQLKSIEVINRLREQWNAFYKGNRNAGKTVILEDGLTPVPLQLSPVDAQLLEQRKYSREQIAAIFRVPVHMLNDSETQKYSNVEQNNLSFFRDALMPIITRIESNLNLIIDDGYTVKFDEKQYTRGDRKSQVDNVKAEVSAGLLSVNEGRSELGRESIPGGDVFAVSTNNLTFGSYDDLAALQAQAALPASTEGKN